MTVRNRYRLLGIFILFEGLLLAGFVSARPGVEWSEEIIGYESLGGTSYPITRKTSKQYQAASTFMFGAAGEAIADARFWLQSLCHGRRLAYTLAVLSAAGCLICFRLGDFLQPVEAKLEGSKPSL